MTQDNGAAGQALGNPLSGLKKPEVRQLANVVRRSATINDALEHANKALKEARFFTKANLSAQETAKAVRAARSAEKGRAKAEEDLRKLGERIKDKPAIKAALAAYQQLEKSAAGGDPTARNLLSGVKAEFAIVSPAATAAREKAPAGQDLDLNSLLNGIGAAAVTNKVGELTAHARAKVETDRKRREPDEVLERKRREPNEFLDRQRSPYPPALLARYSLRGNEVVDKRTDAVAFVDAGKELRAKGQPGKDVIDAMLETAESRGWAPIKVFGTQAFKAAVWMEAASRGMEVTGYKPSPQETEAARLNREINGKGNRVAGTETSAKPSQASNGREALAKVFQGAGSAQQRAEATKQFPELSNAFALVATFQKAIAAPGMAKADVSGFVDQFKDLVAERLQAGKPLPVVSVADREQQRQSQAQQDQER